MPRARSGVKNPANNRSDIPGKVPVMTQPGQDYGKQTAQRQSQRVVPVSAAPVAGASTGGASPAAPGGGTGATPPASVLPGQTGFTAPTRFPDQPLTDGLKQGPGAGPEALGPLGQLAQANENEQGSVRMLLGHLASAPGAGEIIRGLAQVAGATV